MKPYFESNDPAWKAVVPFDKVVVVREITDKIILVFDVTSETIGIEFPLEQLEAYKQWLCMKQKALENSARNNAIESMELDIENNYVDDIDVINKKPEITEEMLMFLPIGNDVEFCDLCSNADKCPLGDCEFKPDKDKLADLNRRWQSSDKPIDDGYEVVED